MANAERGTATQSQPEFRNSYREYKPGQSFYFELETLNPDGSVLLRPHAVTIEDINGGGFFGKVIIPKNEPFVIKTSLPDPWHHMWRTINWGFKEFPARTSKTEAKLEHLAMRILHRSIPILTDGRFYVPNSLGYTKLSTGFAQVIEKIDGRPPRFDLPKDEVKSFRDAQKELTELGFKLGLEQVGQIHSDNPFGMANIWIDRNSGSLVWLDTNSAIQHKGFIWPTFHFKFHGDIKNKLGNGETTFNKIHTDTFINYLRANRSLFSDQEFEAIEQDVALYEKLWQERKPTKTTPIDFLDSSDEVLNSLVKILPKIGKKAALATFSPIRALVDPTYIHNIVFSGIEKARRHNLITEDEFAKAKQSLDELGKDPVKRHLVVGLFISYFGIGRGADALAGLTILNSIISNEFIEGIFKSAIIETVLPSAADSLLTLLAGKLTQTDLKKEAVIAAIPFLKYSVPARILTTNHSELTLHHKVRETVAAVSAIHPAGGYGTQMEASLWERFGKPIEKLVQKTKSGR